MSHMSETNAEDFHRASRRYVQVDCNIEGASSPIFYQISVDAVSSPRSPRRRGVPTAFPRRRGVPTAFPRRRGVPTASCRNYHVPILTRRGLRGHTNQSPHGLSLTSAAVTSRHATSSRRRFSSSDRHPRRSLESPDRSSAIAKSESARSVGNGSRQAGRYMSVYLLNL